MEARFPFEHYPPYGAMRSVRSLRATARRLSEAYEPLLKRLGLRRQEYLVLALLWERDRLPLPYLAARLRVTEGMVRAWVEAMAARGLVERDRSAEPEAVRLTARGRALQPLAPRVPSALLCHVLAWLDHDEVEAGEAAAVPAWSAGRNETGECPDGAEA
ncbi:MAG TPA: MarR family winged helix-turn-helix transcriptional regulator [Rubricoccaceae bacterium]|nr:MarR family winged helix-turn-helix transcriptional regulator [Rubricoccaceae bacterium]